MKILKILFPIAILMMFVGCKKDSRDLASEMNGSWCIINIEQLKGVDTKAATIGEVNVDVYIVFNNDAKTLELYQFLGQGRFQHRSGTWDLLEGNVLVGKYASGASLNSQYTVELDGDTLILTDKERKGSCSYVRKEVPDSIKKNAEECR